MILQRELCEELGILPGLMRRIRADHLRTQDWFTKRGPNGGRPSVWLTEEGERKVRIYAEVQGDSPQLVHTFLDATVLGPAPHKARIWIAIENGEGELVKRGCVVPINLKNRLVRGKPIRVEAVSDRDGTTYRHEKLAGYPATS